MAKKKKETIEEVISPAVEETVAVEETTSAKKQLSAAQIKELLKDYSRVTLKARGII